MAMPMCASRSAGASFTPSPVIATTAPFAFQLRTSVSLLFGRDPRVHDLGGVFALRTIPISRAMASAVSCASPVAITIVTPAFARRRSPRWPRAAGGSCDAHEPQQREPRLLGTRARRDREHAQALGRQRRRRVLGAVDAAHAERGISPKAPFTYNPVAAQRAHALALGVEGVHLHARVVGVDRGAVTPRAFAATRIASSVGSPTPHVPPRRARRRRWPRRRGARRRRRPTPRAAPCARW
jgi:hypothetical protein